MSSAMNLILHISRINYVLTLTRNFSCGVSRNNWTMPTQEFSAYTYCIMPTPGADTEETGRYDLAWKDLCSVLNALSK